MSSFRRLLLAYVPGWLLLSVIIAIGYWYLLGNLTLRSALGWLGVTGVLMVPVTFIIGSVIISVLGMPRRRPILRGPGWSAVIAAAVGPPSALFLPLAFATDAFTDLSLDFLMWLPAIAGLVAGSATIGFIFASLTAPMYRQRQTLREIHQVTNG